MLVHGGYIVRAQDANHKIGISKINSLEDVQGLNVFFSGWALPQAE